MTFTHLPKRLQNQPAVRALGLRVYPTNDPNRFHVPGRRAIYTLQRIDDEIRCDCMAASYRRVCAHALALARFISQQPADTSAAKRRT